MIIKGKAFYPRILGKPHEDSFGGPPLWSFDLSIDEGTQKKLLTSGMKPTYLRNKNDERGVFLTFKRKSVKADGESAKPFKVVDNQKNPWPEDKLIGNGSLLNVMVVLSEREYRKEKFIKPSAIKVQVWEHVPYTSNADFEAKKPDELNDDDATSEVKW